MGNESELCKKFVLSGDWDRAVTALPPKDKDLSVEDYANRAYARCFQQSKDHRDSNYDDAVADASHALVKDCQPDRALCIRAYAYYLNSNYEATIIDCERIIERSDCTVDAAKQAMRTCWEEACDKITVADEAEKTAEADEKAAAADPADTVKKDTANASRNAAKDAVKRAVAAQNAYCDTLRRTAFAHELLGMMYANMGRHHEASGHYKLALLARQTSGQPDNQTDGQPDKQPDIESASPLLMDAYRNACAAVKGMY
jgi:tetratricopeptide (TPR) repeat protein